MEKDHQKRDCLRNLERHPEIVLADHYHVPLISKGKPPKNGRPGSGGGAITGCVTSVWSLLPPVAVPLVAVPAV